MAFRIESRESFRQKDTPIAIKLQFSRDKLFTPSFTTNEQAISNIKNLLLTQKGERYSLPDFGTNLLNLIFDPNVDDLISQIQESIQEAVSTWLPYIQITSIDVITANQDQTLKHTVNVTVSFTVIPTGSEQTIQILSSDVGDFEVI